VKICPQCGTQYDVQTKFCPTDGSTLRSASGSDDIIGSVLADRYHVIRKLGEGGMGQVYLAEHVKMGRMCAIKVMNLSLVQDADAVGRFNREAANASRINHPNIAAIYDFGETSDGLIYLAMEFVEGESLTKLCEALGALAAPRAAEISRQVASALEAAHERGIVHRDLKPDNIMISRGRDGADLVKVVDFGIAKAADGAGQKVTRTGLVVGTPEYMSPEQLTGDTLDGRSDLYALALVTFNMLTGMLPFPGQTTQEALLKRLTDRPLSLAEARPDLVWPPALQPVLDRALSRLASDRYQHASEFGSALVAAVAGMSADAVQSAPTRVISSEAPTPPATEASTATVAAPATTPPRSGAASARTAREKYFVPAIIAAWLVVIVGGAMLMRWHRARAERSTTVASSQIVDSGASRLGAASTPASVPAPAPESVSRAAPAFAPESASAPARELASASVPAPAPAPPPAPVSAPESPPRVAIPRVPSPVAVTPRAREPRAQTSATHAASSAPRVAMAPPVVPPMPPANPAAPSTPPEPAPASAPPANADQARAAVTVAGQMVDANKPVQAMAALRGAMPLLPTRDDSVTALFYLAHAMIQRAATTGDAAGHQRGCSVLTLIAKATSHPKAGEIRSLASQECK
jgi:serine/threonine protein kinase